VFSHLQVTDTSQQIYKDFYPYYSAYLEPLFKGPMPKDQFEHMLSPEGSLIGGSPQEVIDKIMFLKERMGISRYVGQIDIGGQDFKAVIKSIELFCNKVAPVIRSS